MLADCDGTLLDTRTTRRRPLIEALNSFGAEVDEQVLEQNWNKPFGAMIASLAPSVSYGAFVERYSALMSRFPSSALPGASRLMRLLKDRGVSISIVTSGSSLLVWQDLKQLGLAEYVWRVWGFEETEYHKPDPRALTRPLLSIARKGIRTKNLVYIGDSLDDLGAARAKGVLFCAVLTGRDSASDFLKAGLDRALMVNSLVGLLGQSFWFRRRLPSNTSRSD